MFERMKKIGVSVVMALTLCVQGNIVFAEEEENKPLSGVGGKNIIWEYDPEIQKLTFTGSGEMYPHSKVETTLDWENYVKEAIEVELSEGITSVGTGAFNSFQNLQKVTLPSTLKTVGSSSFQSCTSIKEINLPNGLEKIGMCAFEDSSLPASTVIPSSVTLFDKYAFVGTPWLEAKRKKNPLVIVNHIVIDGSTCTGKLTIPKGTLKIGPEAFGGTKITSVSIPSTVTEIDDWGFYCSWNLKSVTIPDSVTSIGYKSFASCHVLTSVKLSNNLTEIPAMAFEYCTSLTSITFPKNLKQIHNYAFRCCSAIQSITLPQSLEVLNYSVFLECSSLQEIAIPDKVRIIDQSDFRTCENLTAVTLPQNLEIIEKNAFNGCSALTDLTIPARTKEIYYNAFDGCTALTNLTVLSPCCYLGCSRTYFPSDMTITGYDDSTAEAYADKHGFTFISLGEIPKICGDIDSNGVVTIADVVLLLRFIGEDDSVIEYLAKEPILDVNADGLVNILDVHALLALIEV